MRAFNTSMTEMSTAFAKPVKTPVPVEVLFDICRRPRFAGSAGEKYIIDKYIATIPDITPDAHGNYWLTIHNPDGTPPSTMFSSHTDTVHKAKAENTPYKLSYRNGWLSVKGGGVLGADDGSGMWIMLNLIKAGVPGLYIFHRDEEIGGRGSSYIAQHHAPVITGMGIKHCIAFDRKGTQDIITHQGCGRCCSDDFADAFAEQLNADGLFDFEADDGGSFTDSANYIDLIGECTNLSVGYYDQHTMDECQDITFITRLVNRLIEINFADLPQKREPGEADPDDYLNWHNYRLGGKHLSAEAAELHEIVALIEEFPFETAALLCDLGYDSGFLERELVRYGEPDDYPGLPSNAVDDYNPYRGLD